MKKMTKFLRETTSNKNPCGWMIYKKLLILVIISIEINCSQRCPRHVYVNESFSEAYQINNYFN